MKSILWKVLKVYLILSCILGSVLGILASAGMLYGTQFPTGRGVIGNMVVYSWDAITTGAVVKLAWHIVTHI